MILKNELDISGNPWYHVPQEGGKQVSDALVQSETAGEFVALRGRGGPPPKPGPRRGVMVLTAITSQNFGVKMILSRRVFRIGVERVWREGRRYYASLRNRTYYSVVEVTEEQALRRMGYLEACKT